MIGKLLANNKVYIGIIAILFIFLVLITYQTASAVLRPISKTDASVSEWFSQGVPLFYSDPAGDVPNADEDMLDVWIQTGDDQTLNFLMELNASPAMESMLRHAVAYIDCDMDDDMDGDYDDILITYEPHEDSVWILTGDQNQGYSPPSGPKNNGQRVGEYLEWGLAFNQIPPYFPINDSDCLGIDDELGRKVKIFTASTEAGFPGVPIDDTDEVGILWTGYDIPNNIELNDFNASVGGINKSIILLLTAAVVVLIAIGLLLLYRRKASVNDI